MPEAYLSCVGSPGCPPAGSVAAGAAAAVPALAAAAAAAVPLLALLVTTRLPHRGGSQTVRQTPAKVCVVLLLDCASRLQASAAAA